MNRAILAAALLLTGIAEAQTTVTVPAQTVTVPGQSVTVPQDPAIPGLAARLMAAEAAIRALQAAPPPAPPPPAPPPPPPVDPGPATPPPTGAAVLYFSDCAAGAAPGCVPGSNSNPGTLASPKRDLNGLDYPSLAAGTTVYFNRGGAWVASSYYVDNSRSSRATPITFDAYGSGPAPLFVGGNPNGPAFLIGGPWGNTGNEGGYVFRNLEVRGIGGTPGGQHWGFWLVQNVRDVTLENVRVSNFILALHASGGAPHGVTGVTVRNSDFSRNSGMGILGTMSGSTIEGTLFEGNNFGGSAMSHAIYLSGGNNNTVRNNRFLRNSVVNGECTGGNFTAHGMIDGLLLEGNLIEQDAGAPGCFGFSITQGYDSVEAFRNVVIRGNTVVNTGNCSICVNSAPGIVIEGNRAINTTGRFHTLAWTYGRNDTPMIDAVVRNNTLCATSRNGDVTNIPGAIQSGNVIRTGPEATSGPCAR